MFPMGMAEHFTESVREDAYTVQESMKFRYCHVCMLYPRRLFMKFWKRVAEEGISSFVSRL
jgi:hypothetical protein